MVSCPRDLGAVGAPHGFRRKSDPRQRLPEDGDRFVAVLLLSTGMSSSYGARQSSIESELARFFADIDDDDASDGADTVTRPADTHRSRTTVRPTLASDDESPPPVAASSSRAGPSRQHVTRSTAEPPRERRTGGSRPEVIDLSALSDDDDVEITGETIAPRPPPASRATPLNLASIPPPSRFPTVPDEIACKSSVKNATHPCVG